MQARWLSWLLLALLTPGLAFAGAADEEQIRGIRAQSNQAIVTSDIAAFSASLADDFVMVRGSGLFSTREQYIESFREDFRDGRSVRYERIVDRVDISKAAPLAAEHGHWVGRLPGGKAASTGTYLAMWRSTSAGWKIRSELFVMMTCDDTAFCAAYKAKAK